MADTIPALVGTAGLVVGECYVLNDGADIVIGRSRSCDISLRRTNGYLKSPSDVRDADHDFNTVSRRHLRLQVHDSIVRLQDLSTNGTYCNEQQLEQSREIDLSAGPATVRLGTRECFQLVMLPKDDPRVLSHKVQPAPVAQSGQDD
jgi:pSer/pThr/pTyr-binding forkhead associated (FHA) protein